MHALKRRQRLQYKIIPQRPGCKAGTGKIQAHHLRLSQICGASLVTCSVFSCLSFQSDKLGWLYFSSSIWPNTARLPGTPQEAQHWKRHWEAFRCCSNGDKYLLVYVQSRELEAWSNHFSLASLLCKYEKTHRLHSKILLSSNVSVVLQAALRDYQTGSWDLLIDFLRPSSLPDRPNAASVLGAFS